MKQQQTQTEILMRQIQAQLESDLRAKSELVRNQLTILTEIQMQNPNEALDLKGLLAQVQEGVSATVPISTGGLESSAPSTSSGRREMSSKEKCVRDFNDIQHHIYINYTISTERH